MMNESPRTPDLLVVKPTFLRLRLLYAAFVLVIFFASLFLALVMFDNGISFFQASDAESNVFIGSAFILVGVLAVGGSLVILLPALNQLWLAIKLERHGQVVDGTVIEKYLEKDKEERRFGFIACVFNGHYLLEQNVVTEVYEQLMEGDTIAIRCLPLNPAVARLEKPNVGN
jgi:hypothetical protein